MEDDCVKNPSVDFASRLNTIAQFLETYQDWDIFLGGPTFVEPQHLVRTVSVEHKLYEISHDATTHMVIYNHRSYNLFLAANVRKVAVDKYWYLNHMKCVISQPYIAYQDAGFSDICKKNRLRG